MVLIACAATMEGGPVPLDLPPGSRVAYALEWQWDGSTSWLGSRVFATDLGYGLSLETAWLSTLAAELVPCPDTVARGPTDWLVPSARADHTSGADVSLVEDATAEDLVAGQTQELGIGTTGDEPYCEAYLLSGVSADPGDERLTGQSIYLKGWFLSPDAETPTPFTAEVGLAGAALPELSSADDEGTLHATDGSSIDALVTITRHPARALDGEHLEELSEAEMAYAFLAGLGRTAEARWAR